MFSMSGLSVRVGFGWRNDAFPGVTLRGEERIAEMLRQEGKVAHNKEFTVNDFFPDKPEPAVSFK